MEPLKFEKDKWIAPNPQFRERIRDMLSRQEFMKHLDFGITEIEPGWIEGEMNVSKFHEQQFGILHGGVVSALADSVAGFSVYTLAPEDMDVVTGEIKISYFKPGRSKKVFAVGYVVKPGRRIAFAESEVYAVEETKTVLLARATTTMVFIER